MPIAPHAATEPLSFSLLLRPASVGTLWCAELRGADGECAVFASPLELLRYLATVGGEPTGSSGLR